MLAVVVGIVMRHFFRSSVDHIQPTQQQIRRAIQRPLRSQTTTWRDDHYRRMRKGIMQREKKENGEDGGNVAGTQFCPHIHETEGSCEKEKGKGLVAAYVIKEVVHAIRGVAAYLGILSRLCLTCMDGYVWFGPVFRCRYQNRGA